uniref:Uncharacterized protein n=1 Tax=Falco tinnunculus TaxID=100819 RepID=A0A8C4UWD9_FALTI
AQQEEVGAAAEELEGQAAGRGAADGVVGAAEAQHRHSGLVSVAQGLVALPVSLPAGGAALGPAEEGFLQLPQRAAAQHPVHVQRLSQGPRVPAGMGGLPWAGGCCWLVAQHEVAGGCALAVAQHMGAGGGC